MVKIPLITSAEADLAHAAAQCVVQVHQRLVNFVKAGQTLGQIDTYVGTQLDDLRCKSCFRGYRVKGKPPFPSFACLSVNECVVHGTAGYYTKPLVEGDVLKIDIGVWHRGWIGDAAWTYAIKRQSPEAKRLMDVGKESLRLGVAAMQPGVPLVGFAHAVQGYVEGKHGLHLVRGLGGHGIGKALHGAPFVSNVAPTGDMPWPEALQLWQPGTLVAVEPMLAIGTGRVKEVSAAWPVFTADGSLSAHYEHDVLVTEKGPRVLSHGLDDLPDVIG